MALNLSNGKLIWYHQATAHDIFDRDFVHTMIVDIPGSSRQVIIGTGKSGKVVGLDPSTGRLRWRTFVGTHHNGELTALTGPTEVLPGTYGGVLTPPASANGIVYVATLNAPDTLYPDRTAYFGGKLGTFPGDMVAINAANRQHPVGHQGARRPNRGRNGRQRPGVDRYLARENWSPSAARAAGSSGKTGSRAV